MGDIGQSGCVDRVRYYTASYRPFKLRRVMRAKSRTIVGDRWVADRVWDGVMMITVQIGLLMIRSSCGFLDRRFALCPILMKGDAP